jgi:hypothetical protein
MEKPRLHKTIRIAIVKEIERWLQEGRIPASVAEDLRKEYDYDFRPQKPAEAAPPPKPAKAPRAPAPKPRQTLAQTLLSESSIRIALYLGAFFVIAASLILAALVEVLRLPILLSVTALFAGGAIGLKRRMPDPSFVLYLVFSALLLVTCGVIADLLNLTRRYETIYWLVIMLGMAVLWALSTRLYQSRLFSLTTLLALDLALIMAASLVDQAPAIFVLFLLTSASMVGIGGAFLLKRWQGRHLGLPVFLLAQIQQAIIVIIASMLMGAEVATASHEWGIMAAATWFLTGALFALCNRYLPNPFYPWIAVGALMPVSWLAIVRSHSGLNVSALSISIWGVAFAVGGIVIRRIGDRLKEYELPVSVAAIPLLLLGSAIGMSDHINLGFILFLTGAVVLSVSHAIHNRWWIWSTALGFGLVAYFTIFSFSFADPVSQFVSSHLAGATFLLLLPDLFLPPQKSLKSWCWPLRIWAIITGVLALLAGIVQILFEPSSIATAAVFTLGFLGTLYLAHAVRISFHGGVGISTLHIALAVLLGLDQFRIDAWLPIMTILCVLYYGIGLLLRRRNFPSWSLISRRNGLVLAGIMALAAFTYSGYDRSIYVVLLGSLFLVEAILDRRLETLPPTVYSIALCTALLDADARHSAYYLAGAAIVFLGMDMIYTRLDDRGKFAVATRFIGASAAGLTAFVLLFGRFDPSVGLLVCAALTILFILQTQVYRLHQLGYSATAFFALAILFADLNIFEDRWLWVMIITSLLYYGLSILMKRLAQPGWEPVLRLSGVGLASLTALSAPFEGTGLIASLPVAIAATLWAVEAFRRKNAWLGFPANGLYLMSYFMILATLEVEQAQFYTIGAALLGMLMHYILVRAGSDKGAFVTGMFSQLTLIGTSYLQFVGTEDIWYFVIMFFQSLVVTAYGIVIRSRSLVITPIVLVIIGVMTVVFGTLRGLSTVILVGCSGIGLILLGIAALIMRERIGDLRDRLKDWHA